MSSSDICTGDMEKNHRNTNLFIIQILSAYIKQFLFAIFFLAKIQIFLVIVTDFVVDYTSRCGTSLYRSNTNKFIKLNQYF